MRYLSIILAAAVLATAAPARAQNAGRAAALNDEGKELFAAKRYFEAYKLFKEATELDPQGKYYFNVCFTLNFLERYREAVEACEQVEPNGADAELADKTRGLLVELRKRVPAEPDPVDPDGDPADPGDPGDPNDPPPDDPNTVSAGNPPPGPVQPEAFVRQGAPDLQSYRWSVGGELGGMANLGIGSSDGLDQYEAGGFHVRGFANFLLDETRRWGIQGSIGLTALSPGEDNFFDEGLTIFDLGGGAFMHVPLGTNMVLTPLVGLGVSVFQPELATEAFVGANARLESSFAFLFGPEGQHAVSVTPGFNFYSAASGSIEVGDPDDFNLDKPSASFTISVGYSLRFSTPFGATPLITLE